jgi:putative restriction endonuclease
VKAYVGVTDGDWYRFLAARPALQEVNFWQPSGDRRFRVLVAGEPFFFKSHHPQNVVVGGGIFSGFAQLPISEAWELFGEANGVASLEEMRLRVGRYRRQPIGPADDPVIGCIFVRDTRFFADDSYAEPPPNFATNIVQGKSYGLEQEGSYFENLLQRILNTATATATAADADWTWHRPGAVYGDPRLTPQRLGQQSFKAVVSQAYSHRCAVTGDKVRPVLQAAHIRPLPVGGQHRLDNGLLLRSDVHTLFDRGYLGVDARHRLVVSPRLREEFGNGDYFYARERQEISVPARKADRPHREFLEWHLDEVFRAG